MGTLATMSEPSTPTPPGTPRRVGLLADEHTGARLAALLMASPRWELVALAGPQLEGLPDSVHWYDDRRIMIAQSGIEALVLADSPRTALDVMETAQGRGLAIWRLPPLARNFAEATQLIRMVQSSQAVYRVASPWELWREAITTALRSVEDFRPRYTEISVRAPGPPVQSWQAGVVEAGGGVAMLDAYGALESLIAVRSLPDNVSAATARFRRHPGQAPRETEDTAAVIFRYEGGGMVNVQATWDLPPYEQYTRHHGAEHTVTCDQRSVQVWDRDGQVLSSAPLPDDLLAAELERFADLLDQPEPPATRDKTLERHLAVNALLEATYLSARTWHPETPRKFYEVQGWPAPRT